MPTPNYIPFAFNGVWPDIEGSVGDALSYPPQGTLLNFSNLYKSGDPSQGPIDEALQAVVWLKTQLYGAGVPTGLHVAFTNVSQTFSGTQTFGAITANGTVTCNGTVFANSAVTIQGTTMCTGALDATNGLTVSGAAACNNALTVTGLTTCNGGLSLAGSFTTSGPVTFENTFTCQEGIVAEDNFLVTGASAANPCVLTLPAAAVTQLSTNQVVHIFGSAGFGGGGINGSYKVTVIDATHVSLQGLDTTGLSGAYTPNSATIVVGPGVSVPAGYLEITGNLPTAASQKTVPNALYAPSIPKAWGCFTTAGGMGTTTLDGMNVVSAVAGTTGGGVSSITFTFATPMANTGYHVSLEIDAPDGNVYVGSVVQGQKGTGSFQIVGYAFDSGGAVSFVDFGGAGITVGFSVFARQ